MDNASKALIMAGAILIAVALVGVGVYLYSSASGMMNSGVEELISADMITKNAKIEQYEGIISGSELKTLMRTVDVYNRQDIFPETLTVSGDTTSIKNAARYQITINYDPNTGWVEGVSVDQL